MWKGETLYVEWFECRRKKKAERIAKARACPREISRTTPDEAANDHFTDRLQREKWGGKRRAISKLRSHMKLL